MCRPVPLVYTMITLRKLMKLYTTCVVWCFVDKNQELMFVTFLANMSNDHVERIFFVRYRDLVIRMIRRRLA